MILASSSPISWLLALAAAVAYAVPAAAASRLGATAARNALLVAWVLHGAVLVWGLWGDTPRFGFAPALSMTAWLVLTVYAVERQLFPQMQSRWVLAGLGAAAIVLAMVFPGQPLHVAASAWLPLHLALGQGRRNEKARRDRPGKGGQHGSKTENATRHHGASLRPLHPAARQQFVKARC